MSDNARILAEASSHNGMAKLDRVGFEPALLELIADWLSAQGRTLVIACGMVGARQGWIEAPYRQGPCRPVAVEAIGRPETIDSRITAMIIPGLKQVAPPDVMRGEETQIAGLLLDDPSFEGVLCLPGIHIKWVGERAGEIGEFSTFMTGELYGLLADQSVLRHSLSGDDWGAAEFSAWVRSAVADPNELATRLFSIRSETLVAYLRPSAACSRLSRLADRRRTGCGSALLGRVGHCDGQQRCPIEALCRRSTNAGAGAASRGRDKGHAGRTEIGLPATREGHPMTRNIIAILRGITPEEA